MVNKIWNSVLNIWHKLLDTPNEEMSKTTKKTEQTASDNVVDARQQIIDLLVKYFNFSFGKKEPFAESFVVWIDNSNSQYQTLVREVDFAKSLQTELENRQLFAASKAEIVFKTENLPQDANFEELKYDSGEKSGIFIQVKEFSVAARAKISISNNKGSLVKKKYILDASKQTEYNVGSNRETNDNHIIIDFHDEQYPENQRVSLVHAKIVFIADKGFYLQSRNEGNRTIINRDNQRFDDLSDLNKKTLLQNNDEIELGKSVCLRFEVID